MNTLEMEEYLPMKQKAKESLYDYIEIKESIFQDKR